MKYILLLTLFTAQLTTFSQVEDDEEIEMLMDNEQVIHHKAERMPVFPGCEDIEDNVEQDKCTELAIIRFVSSTVKYPSIARENGYQGRVFVTFIVNQRGDVEDIEIIKGVHESIDKAVIVAIEKMPRMEPAVQRGKAVKLKYTIPVNFTLSDGGKRKKGKSRKNKIVD